MTTRDKSSRFNDDDEIDIIKKYKENSLYHKTADYFIFQHNEKNNTIITSIKIKMKIKGMMNFIYIENIPPDIPTAL